MTSKPRANCSSILSSPFEKVTTILFLPATGLNSVCSLLISKVVPLKVTYGKYPLFALMVKMIFSPTSPSVLSTEAEPPSSLLTTKSMVNFLVLGSSAFNSNSTSKTLAPLTTGSL